MCEQKEGTRGLFRWIIVQVGIRAGGHPCRWYRWASVHVDTGGHQCRWASIQVDIGTGGHWYRWALMQMGICGGGHPLAVTRIPTILILRIQSLLPCHMSPTLTSTSRAGPYHLPLPALQVSLPGLGLLLASASLAFQQYSYVMGPHPKSIQPPPPAGPGQPVKLVQSGLTAPSLALRDPLKGPFLTPPGVHSPALRSPPLLYPGSSREPQPPPSPSPQQNLP